MSVEAVSTPNTHPDPRGRRLESWKEIAAYLGRDVTTVRRWERREGLPVYRLHHLKLGSIYAYTTELDAWRERRAPGPATEAPDTSPVFEIVRHGVRARTIAAVVALALAVVGLLWLVRERTKARGLAESDVILLASF